MSTVAVNWKPQSQDRTAINHLIRLLQEAFSFVFQENERILQRNDRRLLSWQIRLILFYACFWAPISCIFHAENPYLRAVLIFSIFTKIQHFNFQKMILKRDLIYISKSARKLKVDNLATFHFMRSVEHVMRAEIHQEFFNWEHVNFFLFLLKLANLAIFEKFQIVFNPIWK